MTDSPSPKLRSAAAAPRVALACWRWQAAKSPRTASLASSGAATGLRRAPELAGLRIREPLHLGQRRFENRPFRSTERD